MLTKIQSFIKKGMALVKSIKCVAVIVDGAPPHGKSMKELAEENRKLRCENEILRMNLAGKAHYASKSDEFLRKLAADLKANGYC